MGLPILSGVFGINGSEFLVIILVAVIVVGPQRLPEYTRKLTQMVRQLRVFLDNARSQIAEEVGPEMADLDLSSLDPRQYDPRKIVRDALGEDLDAIKRDLANPLAAVASTAKEASDAVAADVRALAAQERSDSLGKRIEAQAEAARAGSETAQAGAESEAAQGAEADAEEAGATSAQAKEAQGAEAAQGTRAESETAQAGTEAAQGAEVKAEEAGATSAQAKEAQGTGTGVEAEAVRTEAQEARGAEAAQEAEVADVARGSEPGTGEEPMSDTTSQSGSAETASAPQAEVLQKQAAAPNDREQDAVVTGSQDGRQAAASEAAAIPTSLTEASGDLPPRPLSPRDIVRAAKAAVRTRPEAATLTVDT